MRTVAVLGLTLAGGTGAAFAAGDQIGTSPRTAVVARAPIAVSVTFTKPLRSDGAQMLVLSPAGDVGIGKVTTAARTLRRQLLLGSPHGQYTVRWKVVFADGRRKWGEFSFIAAHSNGDPELVLEPTPTPTPTPEVTVTAQPTATLQPTAALQPTVTLGPTSIFNPPVAAPAAPGDPPLDDSVSSGFTVIPLTLGALLVLAAGLIAKFNKPHLRA